MKSCSVLVSAVLLAVAGWSLALHGPAPHGPAPHGPALHGPVLHGPAPHGPALHGPALHGPALHGPAPHGPALHGPALHGPAPHGPALHGPAPHGPALHGPAPHGPALHGPVAGDARPKVACFRRRIRAVFRPLVRTNVHVKDGSGARIPVPREEGPCGVRKWREKDGRVSFYSQYDGCYVQVQGGALVVPLAVQLAGDDRWIGVNISCPRTRREARPPQPTATVLPEGCDLVPAMRMPCGPPAVSMETCGVLGCCFSSQEDVCYYRLNACSLDGHFVFSVAAADAEPRLDPRTLGVRGHPDCLPAVATEDVAVFKIHTAACGARMRLKGDVRSYEVEVEALATDRSPISLQVQCEYAAPQPGAAGRSAGVKAAPTPLVAMGTIGVQMRIATDSSFSSFLGGDQLPAAFPLRSPVHVEVSLRPPAPEPGLSLRVGDCFAYPASRTTAWRLLHHGCPDVLDPLRSTAPVDAQGGAGAPSQVRRFDVKTFAFLDPRTGAPSEEEIYFYCWVEVCPVGAECEQQCTVAPSEAGRRRRRREVRSDLAQLVSVGPLLLDPETHGPIGPTGESCCHRPHTDP